MSWCPSACRLASARHSGAGRPEQTNHSREVVESALAHIIQNEVEAAYGRSDLVERRQQSMNDWSAYIVDGGTGSAA